MLGPLKLYHGLHKVIVRDCRLIDAGVWSGMCGMCIIHVTCIYGRYFATLIYSVIFTTVMYHAGVFDAAI